MADLKERVDDIEEILAHLPEDVDARFAGVDTKLASIREVQALHTTRFSTLERKVEAVSARMDRLESRMDRLESRMSSIEALLREVLDRLPPRQ
jgi:chromosome segregation ATPase